MTPEKLQQAIEYAKKNPTSDYAFELKRRIEGGNFNQQFRELGIDLPSSVKTNYKDDLKGIISDTTGDLEKRADNIGEIKQAQQKGEQGVVRSLFQGFGQGTGAVSDAIGRTVIGVSKALLPKKAEQVIGGAVEEGVKLVAGLPPVQGLLEKFEQLKINNPALARDIDSALGIGTLALDIGTAGLGGQVAKTGIKGATRGLEIAGKGAGKVGSGVRRVGFEVEGALTGTSQETLEAAFQAVKKGGNDFKQLTESLKGQLTPEDLVQNVRASVDTITAKRSADFKNSFKPIAESMVDTSSVRDSVLTKLDEFGVKVGDDGLLDFSASRFRQTPQAQTKLNQMWQEVGVLGDQRSLLEVDTTRQVLRELTLTGDDASARSANALINQSIDSVREAGKQVDGYGDLLKKFAEDSEFLDEISRSLSTGDRATIDTAYRKLTTSLKTNNEQRMNLLRDLDEATGGAILGQISGQQLSELLPRGLIRQIGSALAVGGVVSGGITPALLVPLVFASPRITGEFIRALGLSTRKSKIIFDAIDDARKVIDTIKVPIPIASPVQKGVEGVLPETQKDSPEQ